MFPDGERNVATWISLLAAGSGGGRCAWVDGGRRGGVDVRLAGVVPAPVVVPVATVPPAGVVVELVAPVVDVAERPVVDVDAAPVEPGVDVVGNGFVTVTIVFEPQPAASSAAAISIPAPVAFRNTRAA